MSTSNLFKRCGTCRCILFGVPCICFGCHWFWMILTHTQTFPQPVVPTAANLNLHLSLLAKPTRKETPWRCSTAKDMAVLERNIGFIYRWICASIAPKTSWIILAESSFCLWSDENSLYIRFTHAMVQALYPGSANSQYRIWENCSHPCYSATQNMDVGIHAYFVYMNLFVYLTYSCYFIFTWVHVPHPWSWRCSQYVMIEVS